MPLAAVLWNGGISFGGVISFIFADLIILPIVNIHRKYYGGRMSLYLLAVSYLAMAMAGFLIGLVFQLLGIAPTHHAVQALQSHPEWNYTSFLNIASLALLAVLSWRFLTTGGPAMLAVMDVAPLQAGTVRDPVCGMTVDSAATTEHAEHEGRTYHFCSSGCREAFEREPTHYAA